MDLKCPQCGSEATQKLTLLMNQGGSMEKGAQLGMSYGMNFVLPVMTVLFAILFGLVFGMMNSFVGLLFFGGVLYAGFTLRKKLRNKTRSKYADLSADMKQRGYQCNRCENQFIPA